MRDVHAPISDGVGSDAGADRSGDAQTDATVSDAASIDAGVPSATTLSLSLPLTPPFSTSIHDYYVRCAAADNPMIVTMTAAPGSTIALAQPVVTPPAVRRVAPVTVAAGAAIVVDVAGESGLTSYWVRCLPPDFPQLQMKTHPAAGTPPDGYYLLGNVGEVPSQGGYAMVLDTHGVPVWFGTTITGAVAVDVESLTPGEISYVPYLEPTFATFSGDFERHDLTSGKVSYVTTVGAPLDMHELRILPNGDALVIAAPITSNVDLTGLGTYGAHENMIDCELQEISPDGAVRWRWRASDHFDAVKDSTFPTLSILDGERAVDPFHCNALDVDAAGDLLVSARSMDSVFLVAKATGKVVWKMGGAAYTKDDAILVAVAMDPSTSFYRQHDVRLQPDGTISMFDDQTAQAAFSRAVVYRLDLSLAAATVAWQYVGDVTSGNMGSFRILADGSRVIGWGDTGRQHPAFTEVDAEGHDLLDFTFPDEDWTYRAVKVPISALDLETLRRTARLN